MSNLGNFLTSKENFNVTKIIVIYAISYKEWENV